MEWVMTCNANSLNNGDLINFDYNNNDRQHQNTTLTMTDRLKEDLPNTLDEHKKIVSALEKYSIRKAFENLRQESQNL